MLTLIKHMLCKHEWEADPYGDSPIIVIQCRKCEKVKEPWFMYLLSKLKKK